MKSYDDLVAEALLRVKELMPWDLSRLLAGGSRPVLLDVREPAEFSMLRIPGSINVPRGVLEQSCEWDYDETVPFLAAGRNLEIVVPFRQTLGARCGRFAEPGLYQRGIAENRRARLERL